MTLTSKHKSEFVVLLLTAGSGKSSTGLKTTNQSNHQPQAHAIPKKFQEPIPACFYILCIGRQQKDNNDLI